MMTYSFRIDFVLLLFALVLLGLLLMGDND
jgi:hypothetical protein